MSPVGTLRADGKLAGYAGAQSTPILDNSDSESFYTPIIKFDPTASKMTPKSGKMTPKLTPVQRPRNFTSPISNPTYEPFQFHNVYETVINTNSGDGSGGSRSTNDDSSIYVTPCGAGNSVWAAILFNFYFWFAR